MLNNATHSVLVSYLKSKRQKMNPVTRKRRAKPTRWLYPRQTERHYSKAIRAWFRPMRDYVHKYIKEHIKAIFRGDSNNEVLRNDATTGKSFNIMVRSLDAWVGKYFTDLQGDQLSLSPMYGTESPIYVGLRGIADDVLNFNKTQYQNSAKASLGIDFPTNEDWWQDARDQWAYNNYWYMQKYARDYVRQIDNLTERAVTSGWSLSTLTKEIMAADDCMLENKARFLARDQIGKLNGQITRSRQESAGLSMYVWSTSGDERVRGDPAGFFPTADPSHHIMDEKLCRWDDPTVYSEDGGRTWKDRPYNAPKMHPGDDYNCRCTAMAYWNEIVDEVDEQIDLISENEHNIPNHAPQGLRVMNNPAAQSHNQSVQERQQIAAAERLARGEAANEIYVQRNHLGERFLATTDDLHAVGKRTAKMTLPVNVKIAEARAAAVKSNESQKVLKKELRQSGILARNGNSVYLTPENSAYKHRVTDGVVNGVPFEFRTVTGGNAKIEARFSDAKKKGNDVNVYMHLEMNASIGEARRRIGMVLERHPEYTGKIIVSTRKGKVHFWETSSFR